MEGMVIARVQLFFSFNYKRVDYACAYINWLVRDNDKPDHDTGLWTVSLEEEHCGVPTSQVIDVRTIARATHLIPVYGSRDAGVQVRTSSKPEPDRTGPQVRSSSGSGSQLATAWLGGPVRGSP
jgi:hypothetical protein